MPPTSAAAVLASAAVPTTTTANCRAKRKTRGLAARGAQQQAKVFRLPSSSAAAAVATPALFQVAVRATMLPAVPPTTTSSKDGNANAAALRVVLRVTVLRGRISLGASVGFHHDVDGDVGGVAAMPASIARVSMTPVVSVGAGASTPVSIYAPDTLPVTTDDVCIPFECIRKHLLGTPRFELTCDVQPHLPRHVGGGGVPPLAALTLPDAVDLSVANGSSRVASATVPRADTHLWLGSAAAGTVLSEASAAAFAKGMCRLSSEVHTAAARAAANRRVARVLSIARQRHISQPAADSDDDDGDGSGGARARHAAAAKQQASRLRRDALKAAAASSQALLAGKAA